MLRVHQKLLRCWFKLPLKHLKTGYSKFLLRKSTSAALLLRSPGPRLIWTIGSIVLCFESGEVQSLKRSDPAGIRSSLDEPSAGFEVKDLFVESGRHA